MNPTLKTIVLITSICGAIFAEETQKKMDPKAKLTETKSDFFRPDPQYGTFEYDAKKQYMIYGGKKANITQRPLLELGRRLYTTDPLEPGINLWGERNLFFPHFMIYGDWRTAAAFNDNGENDQSRIATRLNLDIDFKLTATERIHAFMRPLDKGGRFTSFEIGGTDDNNIEEQLDGNLENIFFEGDLGAMMAGFTNSSQSFELPFTLGLFPLFLQNGIWADDNILGGAFAIPAWHSDKFGISNADTTFFFGLDRVSSNAIVNDNNELADHSASIFGFNNFIEANEGYWEIGYAFVDSKIDDLSYHNYTIAFTRRYGGWLSNSLRIIGNTGQGSNSRGETADGVMFIIENSLITSLPSTLVPYFNFFLGLDRPQSLVRDAGAGGITKNIGINFEGDALTGFPSLNSSGQSAYGGAIGIQYLFNLDRQVVFEIAAQNPLEDDDKSNISGYEIAAGIRAQMNLTNAWLVRTNLMYGIRENEEDIAGLTVELRFKF
jgi:hypothetical protein